MSNNIQLRHALLLKKTAVLIFALIAYAGYALSERGVTGGYAKISPGPPLGFTGAPNEGNCTGCHYSFPLNSGGGRVEITGLPASFTPGQSYTVTVTLTHPTARAWGFELTALDANGTSSTAGALTVTDSATTLKRDSTASGALRAYLSHNDEAGIAKGKAGSHSWSFRWTAPAAAVGDIAFYAAGNAANNQVSPEDDYIYTTNSNTNQPLTLKDGEAATSNPLAITATLPVVTIGGKNSTVYFSGLAPGFVGLWQLNAQAPPDAPSGAAIEVVVSYGGKTANRLTIAIE
jgi:uncharacterized protein (TIGR03437 family)